MSSFRILHARGAIPNEVGPTNYRAMPDLNKQPTTPAPRPPSVCLPRPCRGLHSCQEAESADCPLLDLESWGEEEEEEEEEEMKE